MRAVSASIVAGLTAAAHAQPLAEGFNDIDVLPGWVQINRSSPLGDSDWFQGNDQVFLAHAGPADSYIAANFTCAGSFPGLQNLWLLTPTLTLRSGDHLTFHTRTVEESGFADRLQLRLSTSGSSTNVGSTSLSSVGDFATLLLDINPTYALGGVYPETWTAYTVTLAGLPAGGVSGRLAFRYLVEDGGPIGTRGNYIGIDSVSYAAGSCWANCDSSTAAPILNIADYVCFLNRFAAGDTRANCDASTSPPVLNVADFVCFNNRFQAGCP
ncbi:MAG: choice-of-anchor J domain-containing protein [Phycisphaerae bacterium]|nr:choice-of-anchor J domain-containing protein [Phycisphaerae bacterium]